MNKVKINRLHLLAAIKVNRDEHVTLFDRAQIGYRKAVIEALEERLLDAKHGKPIVRGMALPEPQNHTQDYDRIIRMLSMSVEETIEISESEFDMYVMDNWSWAKLAKAQNMTYSSLVNAV